MAFISKKKIIIALAVLLIVIPTIAYFAAGHETRGLINYFAWKTFSKESGQGHSTPVNDITIYYEIHGSGKPLLLLHGGSLFIECFYNQIPALAEEFMVIAPDSRAHGRSTDSAQPLSYRLMAQDMLALLEKLNLKRVSVAGWSDGGIIALDLAMNHPEVVEKLVVIGSNFRADGMTQKDIESIKKMTPDSLVLDNDWNLQPVKNFYKRIAPDPDHWPVFINKIKTMWLSQPDYTASGLKKIKAPTLIIMGENDAVRKEHVEEMKQSIPDSRLLIIKGASHMVVMEKPDELNKAIIDFLCYR